MLIAINCGSMNGCKGTGSEKKNVFSLTSNHPMFDWCAPK